MEGLQIDVAGRLRLSNEVSVVQPVQEPFSVQC